jgi:hypothetical protein
MVCTHVLNRPVVVACAALPMLSESPFRFSYCRSSAPLLHNPYFARGEPPYLHGAAVRTGHSDRSSYGDYG